MAMPTIKYKDGDATNQWEPAHLVTTAAATTAASGTYTPTSSRDTGRAVYGAAGQIAAANIAATPTDLIVLVGSATKIIRILYASFEYSANAAESLQILFKKHTVANTGGTKATAPTIGKFDSGDAAATGVVDVYTANPTIDAGAVTMFQQRAFANVPATGESTRIEINFIHRYEKALVLRGIAQEFAINLAGATAPGAGAVVTWSIHWAEESES